MNAKELMEVIENCAAIVDTEDEKTRSIIEGLQHYITKAIPLATVIDTDGSERCGRCNIVLELDIYSNYCDNCGQKLKK